MRATRRLILGLVCGFAVLLIAGCGNNNVVPISGTLTYKGKAVANAQVHFSPEKGRPSLGVTDANGKFVLVYDPENKGAQIGKHKVYVQLDQLAAQSQPGSIPGVQAPLPTELKEFFEKYGEGKSKVEITVEKADSNLQLAWD